MGETTAGRFFFDLYLALAAMWALVTLLVMRVMRARRVENHKAKAPIHAGAIGAALAWLYGLFFRTPMHLREEVKTQWSRLVPLAFCAALAFVAVRLAMRTKVPPFRPLFAALSLGPTWFIGSVLWSMATLLADDRLHGVGASIDARREHALWVGAGFTLVGLVLAGFLARVAAAPDPVDAPASKPKSAKGDDDVSDDAPGPSRGGRAARRRRRRS
jgi:hypothetical protein